MIKILCNPENAGKLYFTAAPTRPQVYKIYWKDFKGMIPLPFYAYDMVHISESSLTITIKWRQNDPTTWTELHLLSMDVPERFEGPMWAGGIIDEIPDCKPSSWEQHVYPAILDSNGWCWMIGAPEGLVFYKKYIPKCRYLYKQKSPDKMETIIQEGGSEKWACYQWFSSLVLSPEALADYRSNVDERTYRQEMEGEVQSYEGALYYTFDRDIHVNDKMAKHDPQKPLWLSTDFNKSPMVWEVAQFFQSGGKKAIKFIDEVSIPYDAKTRVCAREFIKRYETHQNKTLYLTGDASGQYTDHRDHSTDYTEIAEQLERSGWKVVDRIPGSNPSINNRINIVCSLMKSLSGIVRMYFNSKCHYAIMDMEENTSDGKGGKEKELYPDQTHGSDCVDYIAWEEFANEFYKMEVRQI